MLDNQKTGVGYYVARLTESLQAAHADELELTGYYFNFLNRRGDKVPAGSRLKFHKIWLVPGKLLAVCRRLGFQPWLELFVRPRADVVFFTNYVSLPQLRRRKTALAIYDLSFLDAPEFAQERNLKYLKRFCPPSIRSADVIITISEFTRSRLEYHFPDLKADIVVTLIPPAEEAIPKTELSQTLLDKGVKDGSYLLYVGTIEPRKNLEKLVEAYGLLDQSLRDKFALVLAGGKGWKDEGILTAVAKGQAKGQKIILTGYVSDAEKDALYQHAACFVLPSHYEGFGMPVLEAMRQGAPTALSDIPVFHEVAGTASVYFDKDDAADMAQKLASVLEDESLRKSLSEKGEARLKVFSWQENAAKVYQALE